MNWFLRVLAPIVCLIGAAGCQCSGGTEHFADLVDCIGDHSPELDSLYSPCFDLTRIGQPDWCCCGINRLLCRRGCCQAHCGEPCPQICCPFCLEDREIREPAPAGAASPSGSAPAPKLPPAPGPPKQSEQYRAVKEPQSTLPLFFVYANGKYLP